jgi:hypothetical protein
MQNRPLFPLTSALCTPVWTSYLYYSKPRYLTAFLVNLAAAAAAAMALVMATITRIYLLRQNVKLEKGLAVGRSGPTPARQAAGFRYLL